MEFRTTSSSRATGRRAKAGFTLIELLFGIGIGTMAVAVICALVLYSGKHFAGLSNYVEMDGADVYASETLSRDIRSANGLLVFASNSITLRTDTTNNLTFTYSKGARTLTRTLAGQSKVILRECDALNFSIFQRTPIAGSLEQFAPGDTNEAKVVLVTWSCSRAVPGRKTVSQSDSSARIVMRVN